MSAQSSSVSGSGATSSGYPLSLISQTQSRRYALYLIWGNDKRHIGDRVGLTNTFGLWSKVKARLQTQPHKVWRWLCRPTDHPFPKTSPRLELRELDGSWDSVAGLEGKRVRRTPVW